MIKKFLKRLFNVTAIIIVVTVSLYLTIRYLSIPLAVINLVPKSGYDTCDDAAARAVLWKGIYFASASCQIQTQTTTTGEEVFLVEIISGPGIDCPAGCIYNHSNFVVNSRGVVHDFYRLPSLSSPLTNYPSFCSNTFDDGQVKSPNYKARLEPYWAGYRWQIQFTNMIVTSDEYYPSGSCVLDGTITWLSQDPVDADVSQLTITPTIPDCTAIIPERDQNYCWLDDTKVTKSAASCLAHHTEPQQCYSALAEATLNPTVCEQITDTRSQGSCYFNLAQQLDDSSLCDRSPEKSDRKMCHNRYKQYRSFITKLF